VKKRLVQVVTKEAVADADSEEGHGVVVDFLVTTVEDADVGVVPGKPLAHLSQKTR